MAKWFRRSVHVMLVRARLILSVGLGVAIVATCDVHGITGPGTLAAIIVTPNATLAASGTQQMVAVGIDAVGDVLSIAPTWTVEAGGGTIGPTGIFSAGAVPGLFANTVVASVGAISGRATITVTPGALVSITVLPTPVTLAVTATQQFIAVGKDASGNIVQFTPTWSVVAGGGSISSTGNFTAGGATGAYTNTVQASNQGIKGFATVNVTIGTLVAITITPNPDTLIVGGKQQFVAVGTDISGNIVPITPVWSIAARGGTIDGGGSFTAGAAPGTFAGTVVATSGTLSATATVVVTAGPLATIKVTPNPATLTINSAQQFTAVGSDIAGNPVVIAPTWAVVANGGSIDAGGIFTAGAVSGTFANTVRATSGGLSGFATVNVISGSLASITVTPSPVTMPPNATQQFVAVGRDANGNVFVMAPVWSVVSGGGSIDQNGVFTAGAAPGAFANTIKATNGGFSGFATVNVTALGATQMAANAGNNQAATAGAAVAIAPSVIIKDASNNPVSGVNVTFAVASGGGSIVGGSATTNASGVATVGSWTLGPVAGVNTLTATSAGLVGSPVTFTATGVVGTGIMTVSAGNNQTAAAGSSVAIAPSIVIRDINNNPVIGATVAFAIASGGGSIIGGSATTNASGIATVTSWTLGAIAGANTLTATSAGVIGSPVTFTATGVVGAGTMTVNAGNGQTATAGSSVATAPSVIIKDASNNPVSGVNVTFAVASGGGSIVGGSATTNASGIATVTSWTLGGIVGANTLTATSAGIVGSPITFTATGVVGAGTMTVNAGNAQTATAGSAVAIAPSVVIKDASNNPVSGVNVTFAVASGGGSATGLSATTNASGIATVGSWTLGAIAGANTLSATSAGVIGSPVTFTATGVVGAGTMTVNAGNGQSAAAGSAVAIAPSVVIKDASNNPLSGVSVTFAVASGGGSIVGGSATTNASGIATVGSWTLGAIVGANTLTATSAGVIGSPVTFTATGVVGAGTMTINTGNNQTATAGSAVAIAPSVIIKDAGNNPISGVSVTFAIASGGGSIIGGSATTNASGIATVGSWTLGVIAGPNTLTATSAGVIGSPITFTATGVVGAGIMTVNAGNNQTATAGSAVAIAPSVVIKDAGNNPLSGVTVTFAVASGGGSATGLIATTNASGIATVTSWTLGAIAGANTLTATSAGIIGSPITFTATGVVGAGIMTVNAGNAQTATAGSAVAIAPSVIIKDVNNNPVIGATVTFAVASGGGSATGLSATTNASGIATVTSWTLGPIVGPNTLTATSAGVAGSPVTFTATGVVGAGTMTVNAGNGQTATAGSAVAIAPSVIIKDVNNNPVIGATVTFAVASGGGSAAGLITTTNASGIATVTSWTLGTTAGANTLTATSAGIAGSPVTFTATAVAGAATQIAMNAGDGQTTAGGTAVTVAPSVIVRDVNSNPVSGVTVTFAVASGGGAATGLSATTNASGIATVGSWTLGASPGANTLTATAAGLAGSPLTFSATATLNLGTAASFAVLGGAGASSCIGVSNISGNVGVDPTGTMSGFPAPCAISAPGDGTVHLNDAVALQAQNDVTSANAVLSGLACGTDLTGQDLGSLAPLAPGVYCFTSSAQLTGTLTLSGPANGVWVFRTGSTLTTAAGATVTLNGSAQAANVFWQVGSSAPLGATNSFKGTIIAAASISLGAGSQLTGRALSKAVITMDTNIIALP